MPDNRELERVALHGFSKSWDVFVRGVVAREKLPDWQRLWDDFVQEEIRLGQSSRSSSSPQIVDEEGLALVSKGNVKQNKKKGEKNILLFKSQMFPMSQDGTLCLTVSREEEEPTIDGSFNSSG
jgi:hypothetical protein